MDEPVERRPNSGFWTVLGRAIPRAEIVFFTQMILIYIVVCVSLANLSLDIGEEKLWIALLGSCLGYILPNPTLNKKQ